MKDILPFNRSEQYFTATIFPSLVANDDFSRFELFADLLDIDVPRVEPDGGNVQFITEFSLRKALVGAARERFRDAPPDGDTPDIVILIEGPHRRVLIVLEGKMYSIAPNADLRRQMRRQRELIDYLKGHIRVDDEDIFHAALLAEKHRDELGEFPYPVLTWEQILATYKPILGSHYFLRQLEIALERFDELRGMSDSYGKNADAKLRGSEIVRQFRDGTLEFPYMGRVNGLGGAELAKDIATGDWAGRTYEVRREPALASNPNWLRVADFVARLNAEQTE